MSMAADSLQTLFNSRLREQPALEAFSRTLFSDEQTSFDKVYDNLLGYA
jgi:hypothetical protein